DPVLTITGSDTLPDNVLLIRNAANPAILDVFVNSVKVFSAPILSVRRIVFKGQGGADTLTVSSANGGIVLSGGISFTGGAGVDALVFTGGKYASYTATTATTAPVTHSLVLSGAAAQGTESVVFEDFVSGTDT